MKKNMLYALSILALMQFSSVAFAGYWTVHSEMVQKLIDRWVENHPTRTEQPSRAPVAPIQQTHALRGSSSR